jgi:hypothetical protein
LHLWYLEHNDDILAQKFLSPLAVENVQTRPTMTTRSSSRESLRRTVEGSIGAIGGIVGGWRSSSAPPGDRKKEDEKEMEGEDIVMEDVDVEEEHRGRGRRRSLG